MFNFLNKEKEYFKKDIEPHEVLLDKMAKKKEREFGLSEKKLEIPILKPLRLFRLFSIILIIFLFFRLFQLQIIEGKHFTLESQANRYLFNKIQAQRGVIYDRHFHQLVFNREIFNLVLHKEKLPKEESEKEKVLTKVSQILKIEREKLQEKIEKEKSPVLVLENIDRKTLIILETTLYQLPGFEIIRSLRRYYPEREYCSHLIGYTGIVSEEELKQEPEIYSPLDEVGKYGLEASFEKILRKKPGKIRIERDALGRVISQEIVSLPESGNSLVLWLDIGLQKKIKDSLEKRIQELGAKKAAAVAMDPRSGGILALLSLPSFDNNLFSFKDNEKILQLLKDPNQPLFNRAISGEYVPGSTIKPLIAVGILEENIVDPIKKINCQGKIIIPNPWDPTSPTIKKDWKTHGPTDLRKALAESCNVYFYTFGGGFGGEGLGVKRIKKYLELFGWGKKTGIALAGEREGLIPDPEWKEKYFHDPKEKIWRDGDTYNLAIGQGFVLATPLQVASAFCAIANGGTLFQPQLVQKIVDASKNVIEEIKPQVIRENFINPQTIKIVREGMRQAVTGENSPSATATLLNSLPVSAAAKTGTAEFYLKGKKFYHTWVTVFAPYENPEIVLTLVIEDVPEKEIEHQLTVLPVAKEILEWYFTHPN